MAGENSSKVFRIKFGGKTIVVKDYSVCKSIFSHARGLMFRNKNYKKPLLFVFEKAGMYPIHSFFCRKFVAVWMLDGKIIEIKVVKPWKFSVTPKEKFNLLLEIPAKI